MPDMLVKLYELPDFSQELKKLKESGIEIRRALPPEKNMIVKWVGRNFDDYWASECDVAISNKPVSCFIAMENGKILGFACYDATCKDFFGPTGVEKQARGRNIGKGLLLTCLSAMVEQGYAYAIIGGAGPVEFYRKCAAASVIEGSVPGIFKNMLSPE